MTDMVNYWDCERDRRYDEELDRMAREGEPLPDSKGPQKEEG